MKPCQTLAAGLVAVAALTHAPTALGHLTYAGRNFGSFSGLSDSSVMIENQAVTGNFGWADASDGNLGDSHRGRAFRFPLENPALVTITFEANPTATASSLGGLIPGISLYQGLAAIGPYPPSQTELPSSADHDGSEASVVWRTEWARENLGLSYDATATDGGWNALGSWKIGGDGDLPGDASQLSSLVFRGFGVDYDLDGNATLSRVLDAGDYTILVGGNDLANQGSASEGAAFGLRGSVAVQAIPEPGAWVLAALGAATLTHPGGPRWPSRGFAVALGLRWFLRRHRDHLDRPGRHPRRYPSLSPERDGRFAGGGSVPPHPWAPIQRHARGLLHGRPAARGYLLQRSEWRTAACTVGTHLLQLPSRHHHRRGDLRDQPRHPPLWHGRRIQVFDRTSHCGN